MFKFLGVLIIILLLALAGYIGYIYWNVDEWAMYDATNTEIISQEEIAVEVPFTRESWNGRMKACRGVGASLPPEKLSAWEQEHIKLLEEIAQENFTILHEIAIAELRMKG